MKPIFAEFEQAGVNGAINNEQELGQGGSNMEQKTCIPLYTLLLALGNPSVHYFSLDIEGAELKVLKAIPWHLVDIWMVGIETNHIGEFDNTETRGDVLTYMVSQGYKHIGTIGIDDMFIKPDKVDVSDELITYLNSLMIKSEYPNEPQI
ncbi:uncharacterized protein LOC111717714 [Eurytemora carolleeae]|uniref:uncharacterized protein LOC111717714 n=1 Tax=Eurytemora carolleeae TaxID=1294199 RepID=UPI000C777BCB|nr:uncharacterized protein LOC111717714 [Eurytemora carolleeae]|eukprot:XP_023348961.1 uncharacterized protein LOC111717714 [Eurytemora affinis]